MTVSFRGKYYQQQYSVSYKECHVLVDIAKYKLDEGIVRVSCLYRKLFPNNTYKSDKAVRRLLQVPVAIFRL